jgi:RHS repeat-associated protein
MIYGSSRIGMNDKFSQLISWTPPPTVRVSRTMGLKSYELTDHLGNVLTTISNRKKRLPGTSPAFEAVIETAQDYYPFGSLMPGRKYNAGEYRFGFNGQEKDDEIAGVTGSHVSFKYRIYDSRIARFFTIDPLALEYPYWTPYQFAGLMPIWAKELEGLEPVPLQSGLMMAMGDGTIDKVTADVIIENHGKLALGGVRNLALIIGVLNPFTSTGTISTLVTTPLAITSAGLAVGKGIASITPTVDKKKVEDAPDSGIGVIGMGIGVLMGKDPVESGIYGDILESLVTLKSAVSNITAKEVPGVITEINTIISKTEELSVRNLSDSKKESTKESFKLDKDTKNQY